MSTSKSRRAKAPSYRLHKPSGQAFVQLKKRRYYLGKHNTPASREAYARFLAEHWSPLEAPPPPAIVRRDLAVTELIERFWLHALDHYRDRRKQPTGTADNLRPALRKLKELYGPTPAAAFGPMALKSLRQAWISAGLAL